MWYINVSIELVAKVVPTGIICIFIFIVLVLHCKYVISIEHVREYHCIPLIQCLAFCLGFFQYVSVFK